MRTRDIKLGKAYVNGAGSVRLVIAEGPEYVLIDGQTDLDCVRYRVLPRSFTSERRCAPHPVGSEHNCTRNSFAGWALREVEPE